MSTHYPPASLQAYNSNWYSALVSIEESLLEKGSDWTSALERYSAKLTAWLSLPRYQVVVDLLHSAYGYHTICVVSGISEEIELDAYSVFSPGVIVTRSPDYYLGENGLSLFNADIDAIPIFVENVDQILGGMAQAVKGYMAHAMFNDLVQVSPTPNKQQQIDYFFNTKHFKEVYMGLNVSPLSLPSSLT